MPVPKPSLAFALLPLSACAVEDTRARAAVADPWQAGIFAQIRNDAHTFVGDASGETFRASSPRKAITGHFDADGARLVHQRAELGVRTIAWGRERALLPLLPTAPQLGACVVGRVDPKGECVRRLEYAGDGLTEWWTSTEEGFEQGWTVDESPAGGGHLLVDVEIEGDALHVTEQEVSLVGDDGGPWIVSGLAAWDADGNALDVRFQAATAGFRVRVDDRGARYPVTIDPVYETPATTLSGGSSGDDFGHSVSGAGDVNGDGFDDVIVGAPEYGSYTGRAYVYHGSRAGLAATASAVLTGIEEGEYYGWSVAGAGDVDADGFDDVIVGAPGYLLTTGRVEVWYGSGSGVLWSETAAGGIEDAQVGASVAAAGDVNGDGVDDVIIGAPGLGAGVAFVCHGTEWASTFCTTGGSLLEATASESFGSSVAGAGDVNGDGFDDVIVGDPFRETYAGAAYLFHGSSTGASETPDTTLVGDPVAGQFGGIVSGAGNVNGDAYADVIVAQTGTLASYVFHGGEDGVSTMPDTSFVDTSTSDLHYTAVASAGDVNNDGYDDILLAAYSPDDEYGQVVLIEGSATGADTATATLVYEGDGVTAAGAGDVNRDQSSDVVVGAADDGLAYVFHGYDPLAVDGDGDGFVAGPDCDDTDAAINPDATEVCNGGVDDDCDGARPDGLAVDRLAWYRDDDGDGYGYLRAAVEWDCEAPSRHAATHDDCEDEDASIHPGAAEEDCEDPMDYNCDGSVGYSDGDGDGYGACQECDDRYASVNPAAVEACNGGVDDNCDGLADDASATGQTTWYADLDDDGYGALTSTTACAAPEGYAAADGDCDDADATYHPGAAESDCTDPADYDCDGVSSLEDVDGDGYPECEECDDTDPLVSPGGTEVCNGVDDDCDGVVDDGIPGATLWYEDRDGDGYGVEPAVSACDAPSGGVPTAGSFWTFVPYTGDCEPGQADVYPGAVEVLDDGIDQNCDGVDALSVECEEQGLASCASGGGRTAIGWLPITALALVAALRRRRSAFLAALMLSGCASPPSPDTTPDAWEEQLSARFTDASRAFAPAPGGYRAESRERAIVGLFDAEGARLVHRDGELRLRTAAWGRSGALSPTSSTSPQLGACVAGKVDPGGACVRRLEYPAEGLTEWWVSDADGFEQGWTLDARPPGAAPLEIEIAVDAAEVTHENDGLWLNGDDGGQWIVSAPLAWDATGAPLDVRYVRVDGGFGVRVNDAGARYPITVDPIYSTPSTTLTESSGTSFGYAIAPAGDVNGDTYADVLVSTYDSLSYVYHGSASGVSTTASTWLPLITSCTYPPAISTAGDVNGDGFDDVIYGASCSSGNDGMAVVYHGSATGLSAPGLSATASTTLTGTGGELFGASVSNAGDVNGDTYDDVIVGAYGYDSYIGRVHVFYGSGAGVTTAGSTSFTGAGVTSYDYFGWVGLVSEAGDVDNDGYDDVFVGTRTGEAWVYYGSSGGLSTTDATAIAVGGTRYGVALAAAGDVNGDTYADVILGSQASGTDLGEAYVFHGSATGLSSTANATFTGETVADFFGESVGGAGDVDGDGYDDVIISAMAHDNYTGKVYVYSGSATGVSTTATTTLTGAARDDFFGSVVCGAGDVNLDGEADVMIAAYGAGAGGEVYVYIGSPVDADEDWVRLR